MRLTLVVAHDEDLVIGKDGTLPWRIPGDLKHFKAVTMGKPVLMGRKTWQEIGCTPLPGRLNVVVSSSPQPGVATFPTPEEALDHLKDHEEVCLIGGARLYEALLPRVDRMIISEIPGSHPGDTRFPDYRAQVGSVWRLVGRELRDGFDVVVYDRYIPVQVHMDETNH